MNLFSTFVTANSKLKLSNLKATGRYDASPIVYKFLQKVKIASSKSFQLKARKSSSGSNRTELINSFIYYHKAVNDNRSPKLLAQQTVFEKELHSMWYIMCFDLVIEPNQNITFNIISKKPEDDLVSIIVHATHTFATVFPVNHWNGLTINVCLDDTTRDLVPNHNGYVHALDEMYLKSMAFNVSGMTQTDIQVIYLTKKEEMIKLLFHELAHYTKLDRVLYNHARVDFGLDSQPTHLNCSEVYAESMSILFNVCYQSVHLWGENKNNNLEQIFRDHLNAELFYTCYLSGSVLKFYGYNKGNVTDFFSKPTQRLLASSIATWEYIILRGQLLSHLNEVAQIVDKNNWAVTPETVEHVINLMRPTRKYIECVRNQMGQKSLVNISYTMIELDWKKISAS